MTRLSVNINKVATLRNARGGNMPNVLQAALNCERFGAEGITVHTLAVKKASRLIGIDRDRFQNDGQVYYNGALIPNERLFSEE